MAKYKAKDLDLQKLGINDDLVISRNLSYQDLVSDIVNNGEGHIASSGAAMIDSGKYTGRSPKDKYIVDETSSNDKIWWGEVNQKISEKIFDQLHSQVIEYYNNSKTKTYMFDGFAGAEKAYNLSVRFLVKKAWQAHFVNNMFIRPETDQEDVAKIVAQYNFLAVPVLDSDSKLLGIVTVDDVVDVIREEATEDFLRMAGAGKDREILLKSSWENAKARLPWLFASWIGGIVAASIIGAFENMLANIVALAAFIPVILGMGGNIATQSSTIIVRGMATGRVNIGGEIKLIFKEIKVGLILGSLYGILLGVFAKFAFTNAPDNLGFVVGLSICASMIVAATVGTIIPLILRKLDIDPAIATGPFVTTSIDILGVLFYFLIAGIFLRI